MSGTEDTGNGGHSTAVPLCCSFLLMLFPCTNMSPLHGLQPFRLNLLQHGSSMGISSCKEYLLQHGLSAGGSPFRKYPPCSSTGSSMGCSVGTSSMVISMGFSKIPPSPRFCPWAAGKFLFQCLELLLSLLFL